MAYRYVSKYCSHKENYNNPLMLKRRLWELRLMQYSWKFTKRVTCCGKYNRIRKYRRNGFKWKNPLVKKYKSKDEERMWGKFDR